MNTPIVVYEDHQWSNMLPLVYTRPTAQLVCGAMSLLERVVRATLSPVVLWTRPWLAELAELQCGLRANPMLENGTLFLNGRALWTRLPFIEPGEDSWVGLDPRTRQVVCVWAAPALARHMSPEDFLDPARLADRLEGVQRWEEPVALFDWPWQLLHAHPRQLAADWALLGARSAAGVAAPPGVHLLNPDAIHLGEGSRIKPCVVIDAEDGPVWIGRNVRIMPHSYVQGPAYIGEGTLLQTGAVVREGTYIGPTCKVGGEIEGSIIQGFSNKQHDGFLGHSYVGSWINIAADCINSDLKNTYGTVRVPIRGREVETGEMFVGMLAGDHSKIGINVSIPTGAVIGFNGAVFSAKCPKFVPSFRWVEEQGTQPYHVDRAVEVARRVMARRKRELGPAEEAVFRHVAALAPTIEEG